MTLVHRMLRLTLIVTALAGTGVVLAPGSAAAAHPQRLQPFAVDSGDACKYGSAAGTLTFRAVHPPETPAVDVWGSVVDRPLPDDPRTACRDDGWFTIALFTAYHNIMPVDREAVRVDNGKADIRITLGDDPTIPQLSLVEVRVCRTPVQGAGVVICGKVQQFTP